MILVIILVIINLLTSNSKPHLKCEGGCWGLNVCVCGGGGLIRHLFNIAYVPFL